MSGHGDERPAGRVGDDQEPGTRIGPGAALGLTDDGRRVLALLRELDLLPPGSTDVDDDAGG